MRHKKFLKAPLLALILCVLLITSLLLPVSASVMDDMRRGARDAVSDVGNAVSDAGGALSEAMTDMFEGDNGKVSDSDGIIKNEQSESMTEPMEHSGRSIGWIGIVIALAVAAAVIALIVFLVPKRRG
jgi:predicted PurR-regulated permease PerM